MPHASALTLVPRAECLRESPYLAHAVTGWQRAHAPDDDPSPWLAEMCDTIEPDPVIRWAESMVLYLPTPRIDQVAEEMGPALARLLAPFGARTLTLLQAWPNGRWPTRRRTPPVLADAARRFRAIGAGTSFTGGIRVPAEEAAAVLAPLLWSVRMDAAFGPVYMAAGGAPLVFSLCQYLNLHLDIYSPDAAATVRETAPAAGFAEPVDGTCRERSEASGAIPGRALIL